jgi:hypothetical protein
MMFIGKAPPIHFTAQIDDYTNFPIFFLLCCQKVDWPRAGIIRFEHDDQNNHDLSMGWVREARIKGTHLGVGG